MLQNKVHVHLSRAEQLLQDHSFGGQQERISSKELVTFNMKGHRISWNGIPYTQITGCDVQ